MMDRREFIRVTTLASGALVFGIACGGAQRRDPLAIAQESGNFAPNVWLTLTPQNRVIVHVEKSEMGQGILTSHAMLVAEELEMPLGRIDARSADAAPEYRSSLGVQQTGGSTSLKESWVPIRTAAAAAREMLVAAAAAQWGVAESDCVAESGQVRHPPSNREVPYGDLTLAAAKQPVPRSPRLKSPDEFRVIGKEAIRTDARAKVDGTGVFGIDVELPNMAKAYVIRPPVLGAEPITVVADEAKKQRGIIDVIPFHRGVAVLADKYWQARRAAPLVEVTWGDSPLDGVDSAEVERLAREVGSRSGRASHTSGDVRSAMRARESRTLDVTYEAPYLAHATLEPLNCTAHVREGEVEIWAPTQTPTTAQRVAAAMCGVKPSNVTVHVTLLGGGFGRKAAPDFIVDAVAIAMKTDRPVQVLWSREDDMRGGYYRPFAHMRMQGAIDADGKPAAWRTHIVSQPVTTDVLNWFSAALPPWVGQGQARAMMGSTIGMFRAGVVPDILALEGASDIPYDVPNQSVEFTPIQTTIPSCFWRAVGHSYTGFCVESFVDEMAHAAGRDPFEFRREHMNNPRLLRCLERAAKESGWGTPTDEGYARGIAAHESFGSFVAEVVEAGIVDGKIDIKRITCVVDCGIVVNPDIVRMNMEGGIVFGLSAAMKQKITFVAGQVVQGNYDDYPLLRMHETPDIDVFIIDSNEQPSGVGEPGLPPIGAALANALFAATGLRLRTMPFEDALAEAQGA